MEYFAIAIDGPSGAGKSTLAKSLAKKLGAVYVDTGAMYRAIGLFAAQSHVDAHDAKNIIALLPKISLELKYFDEGQHIFLNGVDVSEDIRTEDASRYASAVSAIPEVRSFLLDTQRALACGTNVVMDGRDIGTVVLPCAQLKIFLTADTKIRAKRRYDELLERGQQVTFADVCAAIAERDKNDSHRTAAPLKAASDAITVDSGALTLEQTLDTLYSLAKEHIKNV